MTDPRLTKLAKNLINYSCALKKGEKILIEAFDVDYMLLNELVKEAYAVGAYPFVELRNTRVSRELLKGESIEHAKLDCKYASHRMSDMDAYIGLRGSENSYENADIADDKKKINAKYYGHPVHHEIRVKKTKWVVLRYPNPAMAQASGQSTEAFEQFYFDVCCLDYAKMDAAMTPLKELMEKTDRVRIKGPGETDLTFSIKGIPAIKCAGDRNIPDGEVYTAPVKNSINGILQYNAPSNSNGLRFENVRFEFEKGKIVKATANFTEELNNILNTDDGARYVGEFSFGLNPYINRPMGDILFDEKIAGSFHFTPGQAYEEAWNGNESAIHWDLVCIQTPAYGGGEIYLDDVLIRKDGLFVVPALLGLNPERLKG
jgi:aminopeptidase